MIIYSERKVGGYLHFVCCVGFGDRLRTLELPTVGSHSTVTLCLLYRLVRRVVVPDRFVLSSTFVDRFDCLVMDRSNLTTVDS